MEIKILKASTEQTVVPLERRYVAEAREVVDDQAQELLSAAIGLLQAVVESTSEFLSRMLDDVPCGMRY